MVGTNLGKCEWVWEEKLRWLNQRWWNSRWQNSRWQNSRWLPSSSSVRMNEFESDWISLSQSFVQNGWIQDGRFQDGCHHQVSQNEWVKVFFVQMVGTNLGKCEWVWEGKLRWLNPTWQNSRWLPSSSWVRMNEFESDWISLSQSQSAERVFLSESERRKQGVWIQHGRIQDGCNHQV